ncbi:group 1 truncated hemoglobin [Piscinibacter aquaticus]|uniref:Group 1 truncated hemoglobin n=1 Tax=Piscinibacter aquaticus TaxID=392597 RepID=A0A5C6U1D9_9BURK|nr:group 1 truncated hemoglobin [Piscinibacter aquaticus]
MNRFTRTLCAFAAVWMLAGGARAQAVARDDSLYQSFGGQNGLVRLMDDFMTRLLADARMRPFFKDADQAALKKQLVLQFCEVSGGPCRRDGPTMKEAHDGMDITRGDFNALVEVLQDSMSAQGVPFAAQNRLLARLAPMHRDIVNTP